jgi:hypothetical protein
MESAVASQVLVSQRFAVHHGNAMDRPVAANSWPFLTYDTDNLDLQGNRCVSLKVENTGVGPARIQTFEVWWQGQPVSTAPELIERCCLLDSKGPIGPAAARSLDLVIGRVAPDVMRAVWHRLDVARLQLKVRACSNRCRHRSRASHCRGRARARELAAYIDPPRLS